MCISIHPLAIFHGSRLPPRVNLNKVDAKQSVGQLKYDTALEK